MLLVVPIWLDLILHVKGDGIYMYIHVYMFVYITIYAPIYRACRKETGTCARTHD